MKKLLAGSDTTASAVEDMPSNSITGRQTNTHHCPEVEKLLVGTDACQHLKDPECMLELGQALQKAHAAS